MKYYLAVDIGASSGRHMIGWEENGEVKMREVYRFPNGAKRSGGHLIWDLEELFSNVVEGIREAFLKYPVIESMSIDTWGVDYVLMAGDREILPCYAYRDSRTEAVVSEVHQRISFSELYGRTGCQFQNFNSVYQLYDDRKKGRLEGASDFLMMPEYLMYRLTGVRKKEYTNATTTGMISAETGNFDLEIINRLELPKQLFGSLCSPGTFVGNLKEEIAFQAGGQLKVVFCATHDTGSAVEGIPMEEEQPYISSGTWSLLGVKTPVPVTDAASERANYSNEGGVGYNRYQKNIMGLWIVQCLQKELCPHKDFGRIAEEAENSRYTHVMDANASCFLAPGSMKEAMDEYLKGIGAPLPKTEADYFRCAFASLAEGYRAAIGEMEKNTGRKFDRLYIVGGGAKNQLLNRLTREATGKEVIALPIEATALGNLKIQMETAQKTGDEEHE